MKRNFLKKLFFPKIIFLIFISIWFGSCVSRPSYTIQEENELFEESLYIPDAFTWQPVCEGFERFDFENKDFPVIYHVVKIDLSKKNLEILSFPDSTQTENSFKGITTKKFARQNKCTVAVNASPFSGKNGSWNLAAKLGSHRQIVGIHIADGITISNSNSRYDAIAFTKQEAQWRAKIVKSQNEQEFKSCTFAFGGFFTVLENGCLTEFKTVRHDSRTGVGIGNDGKTLYILCVEGEVPSKSRGLSYPQCAKIFKAMGCTDALELDGGGSTQLCINGKSVLSYPVLRIQANSFGFR